MKPLSVALTTHVRGTRRLGRCEVGRFAKLQFDYARNRRKLNRNLKDGIEVEAKGRFVVEKAP